MADPSVRFGLSGNDPDLTMFPLCCNRHEGPRPLQNGKKEWINLEWKNPSLKLFLNLVEEN
jgi:hypothetical protein